MTPNEIRNKTFDQKRGCYRAEEVQEYLTSVSLYVQSLLGEKEELEAKMLVLAEKIEEYREDEDSLRGALLGAQKLGDSIVRDAKKKAEETLEEANQQAANIVNDAKNSIGQKALLLERLQEQVAGFKTQILSLYQCQMEAISAASDELSLPSEIKEVVDSVTADKSFSSAESAKSDVQMKQSLPQDASDADQSDVFKMDFSSISDLNL